jgi:hypothetical protein
VGTRPDPAGRPRLPAQPARPTPHGDPVRNPDLLPNVVNRRPGWRRHLPALLYLLALAALILALARPQATVLAPKEQATVMLVMDVSGSMNAIDVGFGWYEGRAMGLRKGGGAGLG